MTNGESYYTRKLCRSLEAQGALTYPLIADEMTPVGWPDRFVAHEICSCFIECKAYNGRLREDQKRVLALLHERGVLVFVLWFSPDWTEICLTKYGGETTRWGRWSEFFTLCQSLGR